ncbi:MAG TPA: serine hydrolase domain-containing protein [Pirellulales bacterium]|nr:serine hydrolase domain-containing protein [Pirellulales bacterium]
MRDIRHRARHFGVCFFVSLITVAWMPSAGTAAEADSPTLGGVSQAVSKFVDDKQIAGAVTLVADKDKVLHLDATGFADIAARREMKPDAIFWIASMTKPVTATAVMMLEGEGKLSVDDPVAKYIPELASLKTTDGKPAKVTIRHLLTHTSGMAEISSEQARQAKTLADVIPMYASQPLKFTPGERWVYCQSSINTAARVVEVVSGRPFPEFLDERLFGPLKMTDTTFYLREEQLPRLAAPYRRTDAGELEAAENFILLGKSPTSRDRFPAANGGLFSTAADYVKFCQLILAGGELDGRRYLKPESVAKMTTLQTGELTTGFTPGNGWGLGWCVIRKPQGPSEALSPGSFGHGGAYGTQAWIDPVQGRIYLLMVQRANFPNADASDVRRTFQKVAAEALAETTSR